MATKPSEQQFAQLVKEQKSTIYTVCYMFSKDEDEVADLFEEVLVNLWKGFQEFQGRSNPRTWVYRVSLNTCISADRKKKRRKTIPHRIARLGPFDRAIVLLWLENMSYEEIGKVVGISTKNVSVRLFRIKEQLKNMSEE